MIRALIVAAATMAMAAVAPTALQAETALVVSGDVFFWSRAEQIAELAARQQIPTSCPYRDQAVAGCLMSYGANIYETHRQVGRYVGRVLKGEKPADLSVQQPTKFELMLNLKTAKALNLTIAPTLLATADEVME